MAAHRIRITSQMSCYRMFGHFSRVGTTGNEGSEGCLVQVPAQRRCNIFVDALANQCVRKPRPPVICLAEQSTTEQPVDLRGHLGGGQARYLGGDGDAKSSTQHAGRLQVALPGDTNPQEPRKPQVSIGQSPGAAYLQGDLVQQQRVTTAQIDGLIHYLGTNLTARLSRQQLTGGNAAQRG